MKHTKGPWSWRIEDYSMATLHGPEELEDEIMSVSPCNSCIENRKTDDFKWGGCNVPQEADAKLIAAAPDLLEACLSFMKLWRESDMRPEDETHELAHLIRLAIEKATL